MSAASPSAAENLIVQLGTILQPLKLTELFQTPQSLEVELGCGDASFLVEYARRNPQINFIGVERLLGRSVPASRASESRRPRQYRFT